MILTKEKIARLRFPGRLDIDDGLEAFLLMRYGTEPCPHTYSEQDLQEQVRKQVFRYNRDKDGNCGSSCGS